ncbi:MAG: class I SAM-dependent methyltransferase [Methanomassiliicoccaceae archaeon]|nr:class I SAM-dependent methyltransferase [Methanomassiliicoccaceae archaeon]
MDHKDSLNFWKDHFSKPDLEQIDTKIGNKDTSDYDSRFILKYSTTDSEILDLGTGGGVVVNKLNEKVGRLVCVEMFEEISRFIVRTPNVSVVNENIFNYRPKANEMFDLITAFGTLQYFNESEARELYNRYVKYLRPKGNIIIKQQFGVNETVTIQNYSKELDRPYFAQYRTIELEREMLESVGLNVIEIVDIYPPEYNRWNNTHFYAMVAEKE